MVPRDRVVSSDSLVTRANQVKLQHRSLNYNRCEIHLIIKLYYHIYRVFLFEISLDAELTTYYFFIERDWYNYVMITFQHLCYYIVNY